MSLFDKIKESVQRRRDYRRNPGVNVAKNRFGELKQLPPQPIQVAPAPTVMAGPTPEQYLTIPLEVIEGTPMVQKPVRTKGLNTTYYEPLQDKPLTSTLAGRNIGYRNRFMEQTKGKGNRAYDSKGHLKAEAGDDEIKKIQQMLVDEHYDIGKTGVDGLWGKKTQAAWEQYQKDKKARESATGKSATKVADKVDVSASRKSGLSAEDIAAVGSRAKAAAYASSEGYSPTDSIPTAGIDSTRLALINNPVTLLDSITARIDSTNKPKFTQTPRGIGALYNDSIAVNDRGQAFNLKRWTSADGTVRYDTLPNGMIRDTAAVNQVGRPMFYDSQDSVRYAPVYSDWNNLAQDSLAIQGWYGVDGIGYRDISEPDSTGIARGHHSGDTLYFRNDGRGFVQIPDSLVNK